MKTHELVEIAPNLAAGQLFDLQVEQHFHDEKYHREIARLPIHQRLNHMALHFAKYSGKFATARDGSQLTETCTDTLIIAISTTNVLNEELWLHVCDTNAYFPSLQTFGRTLALEMADVLSDQHAFLRENVIAAARMAAACEKIDHLESVLYRSEVMLATSRLFRLSLATIVRKDLDPIQEIRSRLTAVKKRLKLHGRI